MVTQNHQMENMIALGNTEGQLIYYENVRGELN